MQTIKVDKLSASAFKNAAKQLKLYKKELLQKKVAEFVDELTFIGEAQIENILIGWVDTGDTLASLKREFEENDGKCKCIIRVTSDAIMYLEFGSGLVGEESGGHPLGKYGAFTNTHENYPDSMRENGWWYKSEHSGRTGQTFGLPVLAPMWRGSIKMRSKVEEVARKVFG